MALQTGEGVDPEAKHHTSQGRKPDQTTAGCLIVLRQIGFDAFQRPQLFLYCTV
jgi:hypothetical protein